MSEQLDRDHKGKGRLDGSRTESLISEPIIPEPLIPKPLMGPNL
jgi:hypothetical protein